MADRLATLLRINPHPYVPDGIDGPDEPESAQETVTPPPAEIREVAVPPAVVALPAGGQLGAWEQSRAAVRMAYVIARRQWKDFSQRDGGVIAGLRKGQPPSLEMQEKYVHDRAWVPTGHDGGVAEKSGLMFHALIGFTGVAFGNAVSAIHARPMRWCIAAVMLLAFTLTGLFALGLAVIAYAVIGTAVFLVTAWFTVAWLWSSWARKQAEAREAAAQSAAQGPADSTA
jgi:hypothetical protein